MSVFFDINLYRPILKMIEWDDNFTFGISIIDKEHRQFIDFINKAFVAKEHNDNPEASKELLKEMTDYSLTHFATEEAYMIKFKYSGYKYHKKEHHDFTMTASANLRKVIKGDYQIINEKLLYLTGWLLNHIQVTDRKYIDCFKRNGLK